MPPRTIVFAPGCYYHIYNRGANRSSIFRSDANYRYVISLMQKYRVAVGVSIIAYSLLPNHYHWLVRQDGETPAGKLPQRVFGAYSHAFNIENDRSGTLFEGRYKCISVNSDEYLRELSRYIHANSVLHGMALVHPNYGPTQTTLNGSAYAKARCGIELSSRGNSAHLQPIKYGS